MNALALMGTILLLAAPDEIERPATPTEYIKRVASPVLTPREATRIGGLITRVAKEFDVDQMLFTAIVMQESSFRTGIKSCFVQQDRSRKICRISCDYGLAQINEIWIQQWKLDPEKLRYNDLYNLRVSARILKQIRDTYAEVEPNWFSRYNSNDPAARAIYEQYIEKRRAQ